MILMYHHVAPAGEVPASAPPQDGWRLVLDPQELDFHIRILRLLRYDIVSLDALVRHIGETGSEPARSAVLTFDDGWADNFKHALPVLKRHGITATFFATTQHLKDGVDDVRKMTRRELRELAREGMTIGAHTRSHPDLRKLSDASRWEELAGCKADLEACVGAPVSFLAYPGGCFDTVTVEAVRKAGYVAACGSFGPGINDRSTIHWLYRDALTRNLRSPRDWYRLSHLARRAFAYRVRRRPANWLAPAAKRG